MNNYKSRLYFTVRKFFFFLPDRSHENIFFLCYRLTKLINNTPSNRDTRWAVVYNNERIGEQIDLFNTHFLNIFSIARHSQRFWYLCSVYTDVFCCSRDCQTTFILWQDNARVIILWYILWDGISINKRTTVVRKYHDRATIRWIHQTTSSCILWIPRQNTESYRLDFCYMPTTYLDDLL